jgi:hypothetical protein
VVAVRPKVAAAGIERIELLKEHARQLAYGKVPQPTFMAVNAYADFLRFSVLPYAGGTFDQPAALMEEMRIVHAEYSRISEKQQNREMKRAQRKGRR